MKIEEAPLPAEIKAMMPDVLREIMEYLELEESGFKLGDVTYGSYLIVDDSTGFVIFDYTSDDVLSFAFLQHSLARGVLESGCIGCRSRSEGETLAWSIAAYIEMNPIRDEWRTLISVRSALSNDGCAVFRTREIGR